MSSRNIGNRDGKGFVEETREKTAELAEAIDVLAKTALSNGAWWPGKDEAEEESRWVFDETKLARTKAAIIAMFSAHRQDVIELVKMSDNSETLVELSETVLRKLGHVDNAATLIDSRCDALARLNVDLTNRVAALEQGTVDLRASANEMYAAIKSVVTLCPHIPPEVMTLLKESVQSYQNQMLLDARRDSPTTQEPKDNGRKNNDKPDD